MNELQNLLNENPDAITIHNEKKVKIKHIIFSSFLEGEQVTIPLCGCITNPIATRKISRITCIDCLNKLKELSQKETYEDALNYAASFAPAFKNPDLSVIDDTIGREPTIEAKESMESRAILINYGLEAAEDAPKNMIGPSINAYYANMIQLEIFNKDGTKNQKTIDEIDSLIDSLSAE